MRSSPAKDRLQTSFQHRDDAGMHQKAGCSETWPSHWAVNCHSRNVTPLWQHRTSRVLIALRASDPGAPGHRQRPVFSPKESDMTLPNLIRAIPPVLTSRRAGVAHDTRAGTLLRRHGACQERPQHDDDELRGSCTHLRPLGALRLLDLLRRRRRRGAVGQPAAIPRAQRPDGRHRCQPAGHGLRGLPGRLRHHHGRPDLVIADRRSAPG